MDTLRRSALKAPATKHERVREKLRQQILDGTFAPGMQLPSEKELPKTLRASKVTVVRALNDLSREGLIVRRRGSGSFVADPSQRPLFPSRFLRLGMLIPHSFFPDFRYGADLSEMLRGVLAEYGLEKAVPDFPKVQNHQTTRGRWLSESRGCSIEVLGEALDVRHRHPTLEAVREGRFDGILACSIADPEWTEQLLGLGIPTVLVDNPEEQFLTKADQVYFDPFPAYRAVVREYAAAGFKRIHFVGAWTHRPVERFSEMLKGPAYYAPENAWPNPDSFLRQGAWRMGMDESHLPCPAEWVHYSFSNYVMPLAEKLVALPEGERPEAIVCHAHSQADAIQRVFSERGLPLMAAGATDAPQLGRVRAIRASNEHLGSTAAALLLWKIQQPRRPTVRVGLPLQLTPTPPNRAAQVM